jgi:hypothetical protein
MTRFAVDPSKQITGADLVYVPRDFAFNVVPLPGDASGTLLFGMLELHVNLTDYRVVYVWGYAPYLGWKLTSLNPPPSKRAALVVQDVRLEPGIARRLTAPEEKQGHVDIKTGWVCLGDPNAQGEAVEFASGCIAIVKDEQLLTLWLHPKELPKDWQSGSTH